MLRNAFLLTCCAVAAPAAPPLSDVLLRAGQAVDTFWTHFSAVNCTESLVQAKLDPGGKALFKRQAIFDYLAVPARDNRDLTIDESRIETNRAESKKKELPLLVTSGFPALLLVFHPSYQGGYEYSQPVDETDGGRAVVRVDFRQAAGGRSPSCLRLRGRDYPLAWAGSAWIDPRTGDVLRIAAKLMPGLEDLGVKSLSADVSYEAVRFREADEDYWLPSAATIEASTARQHWRNEHHFTNYKLFNVTTSSSIEARR